MVVVFFFLFCCCCCCVVCSSHFFPIWVHVHATLYENKTCRQIWHKILYYNLIRFFPIPFRALYLDRFEQRKIFWRENSTSLRTYWYNPPHKKKYSAISYTAISSDQRDLRFKINQSCVLRTLAAEIICINFFFMFLIYGDVLLRFSINRKCQDTEKKAEHTKQSMTNKKHIDKTYKNLYRFCFWHCCTAWLMVFSSFLSSIPEGKMSFDTFVVLSEIVSILKLCNKLFAFGASSSQNSQKCSKFDSNLS